jgi:hypothetical protein
MSSLMILSIRTLIKNDFLLTSQTLMSTYTLSLLNPSRKRTQRDRQTVCSRIRMYKKGCIKSTIHDFFLIQSSDSYGKPTDNNSLNKLLYWMRLSSVKSRRNYLLTILYANLFCIFKVTVSYTCITLHHYAL